MSKKLDPEEKLRRKKERDRAYYLRNYDAIRQRLYTSNSMWRKKNPEKAKEIRIRHHQKRRADVLMAYGGKCVCCGLDDLPFLSLDHIQ